LIDILELFDCLFIGFHNFRISQEKGRYKMGIFDWKDNYRRLKKENDIDCCPFKPTKQDVFEQILEFAFSNRYREMKDRIEMVVARAITDLLIISNN
jgi:hypothetical protein